MAELFQDLKEKMIEGMQHTKETATQKGADLQEQTAPAFEPATEKAKDLKNQTSHTTTSTTTENETSGILSETQQGSTRGLPSLSTATDRDAQLPRTDSATQLPAGPPAGGYMQGAAPSAGDPFQDLSTGDAASQQAGSAQPVGGDAWRDAGGVTTSDLFRHTAPERAQPPRPAGDYGLSTVTTSGADADAVSAATPQEQIRRLGGADKKFVGGHEVAVDTRGGGGDGGGGAEGVSSGGAGASDDLRVWPPVIADQAGEVTTNTSQQRDTNALAPEGSGATWRDAGGVATSDQFRGVSCGADDMVGSSSGGGGSGAVAGTVTTSDQFRESSSGGTDALSGATPDLFGSGAATGTITTSDQFREPRSSGTSGDGGSGADQMSGGTSGDRSGGTVTTSDQFRQPVDTGAGGEVEMSRDLGVTGSVTTSDQFRGSGGGGGSSSAGEHFAPGSGAVTAGHSDYGLPRGGFGNGTGIQETSSIEPEQLRSTGGTGSSGAFVPRESATEQAESAVLPLDTDLQRVSVSELSPSGGSTPQASGSSSSEQQRSGADAGASEFTAPLDALAGDAAETHEPSLLEKVTSVFTRS